MAGNLSAQVRGVAQIPAATMDDDFTWSTTVKVSDEMDLLKTVQLAQLESRPVGEQE